MTSAIGFFWLFLAVSFLAMAWRTYTLRKITVPKSIEEAREKAYFAGDDITKLKPIFDHMLAIELFAFTLTAISAFVEFLVS
jgi:small subunit ribosomal protein S17e